MADMTHASKRPPSWFKQTMSTCKTQASTSGTMQRSHKSTHLLFWRVSSRNLAAAWASSLGAPGWYWLEHKGGSSTLGMRYPLSGVSDLGLANS